MDEKYCYDSEFRFDLFEPELHGALSACKYITLPFNIPEIGPEINQLLSDCGKTFFGNKCNQNTIQHALANSKVILDFSWEKINTGHWKDVDKVWRDVYSLATIFKVLCFLAMENKDKLEIIPVCDNGLLLGAPIMGNTLNKIAFKLSEMLLENISESEIQEIKHKKRKIDKEDMVLKYKIPEKQDISKEDFIIRHMDKEIPVVLNQVISGWPALSSNPWCVEYILRKTYFRTVPIEIGSKYTDENWTQKLMTMNDFVKKYIWKDSEEAEKDIGYLAQHNLFLQIPELREDFEIPFYIDKDPFVDISIWFGPSGTISPLHYDPKHNLLAQVFGSKYIRLYSKDQSSKIYAKDDPLFYNTSQVDVENPDFDIFPLFKEAVYSECILKPGQLLYIPPGCWHYKLHKVGFMKKVIMLLKQILLHQAI